MSVTFRLQWCHKSLCLWACLFVCVPFELIDMICAHLAITLGREYKQMHFIEHFRPAVVPFPSFLTTSVDSQEEQSFTPLQSHWDLAPNPILQILRSGKRVVDVLIPTFTVQVRTTFLILYGKLALAVTGLSHLPILTRPSKSLLFTCLFSKGSSSFNSMYVLRPPSLPQRHPCFRALINLEPRIRLLRCSSARATGTPVAPTADSKRNALLSALF